MYLESVRVTASTSHTQTEREREREGIIMRKFLSFGALVVLSALVLWSQFASCEDPTESLPGVKDLTPETFDAEIKGKAALVEFYAPWCGTCCKSETVSYQYTLSRGGGGDRNTETERERERDACLYVLRE